MLSVALRKRKEYPEKQGADMICSLSKAFRFQKI
jgi:hypothetical protein